MTPTSPLRARSTVTARCCAATIAVALLIGACSSDDKATAVDPTVTTRPTTSAPDGAGSTLPAELHARLATAVDDAMASYDVPGAVIGVWVPGQGEWVDALGVSDLQAGTPMTTDLHWPIRSITKSFTVTAIMQLAMDGQLDLDDTVGQYVSGVPDGDQITLRQLADMSSGIPEYTSQAWIDDFLTDPAHRFTADELLGYALSQPPQFSAGIDRVYVNTSTLLLGKVAETVTGQPFGELVTERITGPLGLADTSYPDDDGPLPQPVGYQPDDGVLTDAPVNLSIFGAAGAMVSNLDDLKTWGSSLAEGTLLGPELQAERLIGGPLNQGPEYDQYAMGIGQVDGWWGHTGEGFGITTLVMHQVETGATIVILMNLSGIKDAAGGSVHVPTKLFQTLVTELESLS